MYEEYRYDALGRRVWRRSQGGQSGNYVSRTVWDGDQYLYETISSANNGSGLESDSAMVGYVNADGLDAPVGVWRGGSSGTVGTITPHVDWRGAYALGTWEDGTPNPCTASSIKCSYIAWPSVGMSSALGHPLDVTLPSGYWVGSVLSSATDGSGMQYKRNRYYDPGSGRFTQVDPAGLAGGLNAYGFGGGDQVNFSDPFGLCPWHDVGCWEDKMWAASGGTGISGRVIAPVVSTLLEVTGLSAVDSHAKEAAAGSRKGLAMLAVDIGVYAIPGGGEGKAALSALMKDAAENAGGWRTIGAFTEAATSKGLKGGASIQRIIENEAGDRLVEHTLLDKSGGVVEQHLRPMYKPRDVDKP